MLGLDAASELHQGSGAMGGSLWMLALAMKFWRNLPQSGFIPPDFDAHLSGSQETNAHPDGHTSHVARLQWLRCRGSFFLCIEMILVLLSQPDSSGVPHDKATSQPTGPEIAITESVTSHNFGRI